MKKLLIKKIALLNFAIIVVVCAVFFSLFGDVRGGKAFADESKAVINLSFGEVKAVYTDLRTQPTNHLVANEINERRINGSYLDKNAMMEDCIKMGISPKDTVIYCYPHLKDVVDKFVSQINCEPLDSEMRFKPYAKPMFTISREKVGYNVNEQRLYYDIYQALKMVRVVNLDVRVEKLSPNHTADELKNYTYIRAKYSTDYSHSHANRKHNIKLALSKINGLRLEVGDEFSFNKVVGARTAARGFMPSNIIIDGEYVEGVGGGVCQASTTVYNAAIRADMKIKEVKNHSLPPTYVPFSFDAMVNAGSSDLKFINESDGPIFIKAYGTDTTANVEIYGQKMPYIIKTESKTLSESAAPKEKMLVDTENKYVNETMLSGESVRVRNSVSGYVSEGYLLYYRDGRLTDKKLIRKDVYRSMQGLIAIKP